MDNLREFENVWEKFITRTKGKLKKYSDKRALPYGAAKLILSEMVSLWAIEEDECGRWLYEYTKSDPQKGRAILKILTEEMHFDEVAVQSGMPGVCQYAIPAAGGGLGFGISKLAKWSMPWQAVSTVLPAVLLYPCVKQVGEIQKDNAKKALVQEYIEQLNQYKEAIEYLLL